MRQKIQSPDQVHDPHQQLQNHMLRPTALERRNKVRHRSNHQQPAHQQRHPEPPAANGSAIAKMPSTINNTPIAMNHPVAFLTNSPRPRNPAVAFEVAIAPLSSEFVPVSALCATLPAPSFFCLADSR